MSGFLVEERASLAAEWRLTVSWALRSLHGTYRQSSLRLLWSVVQPLSVYAVYLIVFQYILAVETEDVPYLSFMVVGVTVWRYFAVGLSAVTALVDQAAVLRRVYFRREIVPMSICLTGLIDLGIGTVAAFVMMALQGVAFHWTILALPLVYVDLVLYTAATAILLSTVAVFARDLGHAMPTIAQLLFLATPIMYPASQLPPNLEFLAVVNPIAVLAELARDATLRGTWPSPLALSVNFVLGLTLLVAAIAYLRSIEHRIVDIA
jgi:ABC-type polysaccharide/polyol phosphate export permease